MIIDRNLIPRAEDELPARSLGCFFGHCDQKLKFLFMASEFRDRIEDTEKGYCILGEQGRWTRLGVYIVHSSIILLLIGAMIGSIFGFDGYVSIPEGDTVENIRLRSTGKMQALPQRNDD
jgi:cytochrome c biogenesis protein ResB